MSKNLSTCVSSFEVMAAYCSVCIASIKALISSAMVWCEGSFWCRARDVMNAAEGSARGGIKTDHRLYKGASMWRKVIEVISKVRKYK